MKPTQQEIIDVARDAGIVFDERAMPYYERFSTLLLERFGAGGGEPVAWPAGSAQLHISLLNMGKAMAKERSREIGDAWNQLADLLALLAKSRDTHPSPADLRAEYLRGLEDAAKLADEVSRRCLHPDEIAEAIRELKGKQ